MPVLGLTGGGAMRTVLCAAGAVRADTAITTITFAGGGNG